MLYTVLTREKNKGHLKCILVRFLIFVQTRDKMRFLMLIFKSDNIARKSTVLTHL